MKLIKLTNDHYIIVDDSKIKEGDWFLPISGIGWELNKPRQADSSGGYSNGHCKKITHSTEPLEYSSKIGKYWGRVQPIDLSEVKELIGEVDVEKMIEVEFNKFQKENPIIPNGYFNPFKLGVLKGYNQALEDNKDKKYTIDDMIKCWKYASIDQHQVFGDQIGDHYISFIKSLQPKQEWEVEFVDGKLKLK